MIENIKLILWRWLKMDDWEKRKLNNLKSNIDSLKKANQEIKSGNYDSIAEEVANTFFDPYSYEIGEILDNLGFRYDLNNYKWEDKMETVLVELFKHYRLYPPESYAKSDSDLIGLNKRCEALKKERDNLKERFAVLLNNAGDLAIKLDDEVKKRIDEKRN